VAAACLDCLQKLQGPPGARDAAPDTVLLEPRLVLRGSTEQPFATRLTAAGR
jgi:hypothetical protein